MSPDPPKDEADPEFAANPYAAPKARIEIVRPETTRALTEAEVIRLAHLDHEAFIKAVGYVHYLVACVWFGMFVMAFRDMTGLAEPGPRSDAGKHVAIVLSIVTFLATAITFAFGRGLIRFRSWARWTLIVLILTCLIVGFLTVSIESIRTGSAVGFLALLGGSLIPLSVLYWLMCPKGSMVFSPRYREIVAETSHLVRHSSCALIILGVIGLLVAVVILVAIFSPSPPRR